MSKLLFMINEAAKNWERTKEEKYKKEWYNLVQKISDYIRNYE
jgi:hypothetical protein